MKMPISSKKPKKRSGKLLSVCIPTWNRCEKLKGRLQELRRKGVEVCVSDDASADQTPAVVKDFPDVKYNRNGKNLGMDKNIWRCVGMATGRYIWLLCDDDPVMDGAVERIIEALNENEPDYMLVNISDWDNKPRTKNPPAISTNKELKDFLVKDRLRLPGYVGCNIWRSELFREVMKEIEDDETLGWCQVALLLKGINRIKKASIIPEPAINRMSPQEIPFTWYELFKFSTIDRLKLIRRYARSPFKERLIFSFLTDRARYSCILHVIGERLRGIKPAGAIAHFYPEKSKEGA